MSLEFGIDFCFDAFMYKPRICLSMIVKNEAPVIQRCLQTVKPWVDHWIIADTGSSDGTQQLVGQAMAGVPGTLCQRAWVDFAHNRNEVLELARPHADYVLFIDADEQLQVPPGFEWPALGADGYMFRCLLNGWSYYRNSLVATRLDWCWQGVIHEYLTCRQPHQWQKLQAPEILVSRDGARARDPGTYLKDIEVLRSALQRDPTHTRYSFYLAQSYRDAGLPSEALEQYRRRMALGGWDEECWYSAFQAAVLCERLNLPQASVQQAYLDAYAMRPSRAEPLCELARYLRLQGAHALAHLYASRAARIRQPDDLLFVDANVYAWRALDELAASAWHVGAMQEGREAIDRLIKEQRFPASERARMEANHQFYFQSA